MDTQSVFRAMKRVFFALMLFVLSSSASAQHWAKLDLPTGYDSIIYNGNNPKNRVCPYFINSNFGFIYKPGVYHDPYGKWALTFDSSLLFRTTDGGMSWVKINLFDSLRISISQIDFVSSSHG